ncbi:MAG: glycoside hydrolase family 38 C-terminal domain-containing protein, partial [Bacillota bacterium]|nr:glycoside hydrolase family 38 C-terminal domain-containing protein [Bacillota bacterium]
MLTIENLQIKPRAMINSDGLQRVDISCLISRTAHVLLRVSGRNYLFERDIALTAGRNDLSLLLAPPEKDFKSAWQLSDDDHVLAIVNLLWEKPREWTLYVMVSSHTDIGLHNSQYIQRFNSVNFLDEAASLCDQTDTHRESDRYRYTIEGTWFWNNYAADRSHKAAKRIVEDYIKRGKIGICAGIAGNHTQVYGFEELCRSTYGRRKLHENWGIDARTLSMIDNNGMSWSIVQPYASAGFHNIIFSPNQWNPLPSTIWPCDKSISGYIWNTDAGGGGSRIDIRYDSALPMLFRWQAADAQSELLVWCAPQYGHGGSAFGFEPDSKPDEATLANMALRMVVQLEKIEKHSPYGVWLVACYKDDQQPNLALTDVFTLWNKRWRSPQIRTLGNPDVPFDYVRKHFYDRIPVLRGDMTGGWYQHPLAASGLLAKKLNADRRLANAEKFASLAGMINDDYLYPSEDFSRAWDYLIFNDEHSYGTSGYQGRRVYETWMQHRDWIDKADLTARLETTCALEAIGSQIKSDGQMLAVFNPTARERDERIAFDGKTAAVMAIPPFGYKTISLSSLTPIEKAVSVSTPPVMENRYYKLQFAENGSICSIYDKELARELIDQTALYGANGFVYTSDNHRTFITPEKARFTLVNGDGFTTVTAYIDEPVSGAAITQTVTLDDLSRCINIDNKLEHVCDMVNTQRYSRYLYYTFPFKVDHAKRFCQLNGCEAAYGIDLTGHGTDVYMVAHEWCCAENEDFGVGLIQLDTQLVEFDH